LVRRLEGHVRKGESRERAEEPEISEEKFGELLDRWYEGDAEALTALWTRWGPALIRRAVRGRLNGAPEYTTSDLSQSVLCSLLLMSQKGRYAGDCPPAFRAYVTAMATRRASKRSMRASREIDRSKLRVRSEESDPSAGLSRREQVERIEARLRAMGEPETARLMARGLPLRRIAELEGRSLSAVKNQLGRDRKDVRALLESDEGGPRRT